MGSAAARKSSPQQAKGWLFERGRKQQPFCVSRLTPGAFVLLYRAVRPGVQLHRDERKQPLSGWERRRGWVSRNNLTVSSESKSNLAVSCFPT